MDTTNYSGEWTKVQRSKNSKNNDKKTKNNKPVSRKFWTIPGEKTTDMTSSDPEHYNNTSSDSDSDAPNGKQYHKHISLICQEALPEDTTYMGHPPEETPKDVIKTMPEDHAHTNSTQKKGITNTTNINNTSIDKGEDKGKTYQSQYNPIEELTHDSEECETKEDMVVQNTIQPNTANKTGGMNEIPEDHAHANSTQKKGITNTTNINNTFIDKGEDKGKTYQSQHNPIEELTHDLEECKTKQDMVAQNTIQPNIANKTG